LGNFRFGHNSPANRAREVFKHFKNAESLVVLIFFLNWEVLCLNFFGGDDTTGQVKVFLDDVIRAQEKSSKEKFFLIS